jgi:DNA polymerase/3'-5' exonuclease PolX
MRWGPRYKRFYVYYFLAANRQKNRPRDVRGIVPVDLFITTLDAWGAIMTIRTGPQDFSRELVTHLKYHTPYRQQDGGAVLKATGQAVATPSEEDYFRLAGLPYLPPARRSVTELRAALAAARQQAGV